MKRIIYLGIIVGIILLGLAAGYFFRYQNTPVATTDLPSVPAKTTGGLPSVSTTPNPSPLQTNPTGIKPAGTPTPQGNQTFGMISEYETLAYFVDARNTVTLMTPDGKIIRIASGAPTVLSNTTTSNLFAASFSFDGKYILALSGNSTNPNANLFDTTQRTWRILAVHPISPAWSPVKDQIAYLAPQTNGNMVKTLDATNANASPVSLFLIGAVDLDLSWTDAGHILTLGRPSGLVKSSAWLYDIQKKTFRAIAEDQNGLMVNWDGAKNFGIYFASASNQGGTLKFVGGATNNSKIFSFLTLPSKCVFDDATAAGTSTVPASLLYCAIPRAVDKDFYSSATLPDDYLKYAVFSVDDIFAINLTAGDTHPVWNDQNRAIDATNLQIKNRRVFFINRYDEKLYAATIGS